MEDASGVLYLGLPSLFLVYSLYLYFFGRLSHIPGPFISGFCNFWKINAAYHAEMPQRNIALHRKYGPLVRVGPNMISLNEPEAYSVVNGFRPVFKKTQFYSTAEAWYKGKPLPTVITERDPKLHSQILRVASSAYSAASGPYVEAEMQSLVDLLLTKIDDQGKSGKASVNTATLLAHYAFDAMGIINVSEPFGFLKTGTDIGDAIGGIDLANIYFSVVAQAPWMHAFLLGNGVAQSIMEKQNPVLKLALKMMKDRLQNNKQTAPASGEKLDFLRRLLEVNKSANTSDTQLSHDQILSLVLANTMAGYATVAITLRSILYNLARNRQAYVRLQRELDDSWASGALPQPPNYKVAEAAKLPYLDAVITEALRIHPVLGLILEREVPEGGVVLAGQQIPQGTIVGFNPWVILSNVDVYGHDAHLFRPERWLEADEKQLREMKRCNISFGAGPRSCQGRTIAMMEILKLIPALMYRFDFALTYPEKEWKVNGYWFTMQSQMDMVFTPRK